MLRSCADSKRKVTVTFRLSTSHAETVPAAAPRAETSIEEAKSELGMIKKQLEEKQVVLDKLGKFRGTLDLLKTAVEALSGVRTPTTVHQYLFT
jgi:exonuclease VII small subunit